MPTIYLGVSINSIPGDHVKIQVSSGATILVESYYSNVERLTREFIQDEAERAFAVGVTMALNKGQHET